MVISVTVTVNLNHTGRAGRGLPILTTGHDRLHSCLHRFGLHLSLLTMAIRVSLSCVAIAGEATASYCKTVFESPAKCSFKTLQIISTQHNLANRNKRWIDFYISTSCTENYPHHCDPDLNTYNRASAQGRCHSFESGEGINSASEASRNFFDAPHFLASGEEKYCLDS